MSEIRIDHQPSISPEEYRAKLDALAAAVPAPRTETVDLADSLNRVLAGDLVARVSVPGFANSAMDGYAVRAADLKVPAQLEIIGEQAAGPALDLALQAGQAIRIMTGAPLPQGADAVAPSEITTESGGVVEVLEEVPAGANVRGVGEDIRVGAVVLGKGTRLGPRQIGAAAAVGIDQLEVFRPLRVAVVSTGDELAPPGGDLVPGQIYESNSYLLAASVAECGLKVSRFSPAGDRPEALAATFDRAVDATDVILVSGGVSVGKFDVVRGLLGAAPDSCFVRVSMQPGKPQGHGIWRGVPVLAFPGNPVGAFVSFQLFGLPFLQMLSGQKPAAPRMGWARAGEDWRSPAGRRQFLPARVVASEGDLPGVPDVRRTARLGSGSHLVTSLARAEVLVIVDEATTHVAAGDPVRMMEIQ